MAVVAAALAAVGVALAIAFFALRNSTVFSIDTVEVEPTAHVTEEDIQNLVRVPVGSTLLNLDTASIEEGLRRDPWVAGVEFERVFPHTLRIVIVEQAVDALVVMNAGSVAWYLGDAGAWIQPTGVEPAEGQSVNDAALATALEEGCLLITDVPATVSPVAGSEATDDVLHAVESFRAGFSESFSSQVVSYSAPAADSIVCTLSNGVEVLLGSPTDISTKEEIVTGYLEQFPAGSVTYINVRVVTKPAVRVIDSGDVEGGDGVVASSQGTAQQGDSGTSTDSGSGTDSDGGTADDAATGDATGTGMDDSSDASQDGSDASSSDGSTTAD